MFDINNLNFVECDTCKAKPGSPVLCEGCYNNRTVIFALKAMLKATQGERDHFHEVARRRAKKGEITNLLKGRPFNIKVF